MTHHVAVLQERRGALSSSALRDRHFRNTETATTTTIKNAPRAENTAITTVLLLCFFGGSSVQVGLGVNVVGGGGGGVGGGGVGGGGGGEGGGTRVDDEHTLM